MEINTINNSILEACASGGGNFITQSKPTYFHSFLTRKILVGDETMEDFMEVTPAQRTSIEKNDASFVQPPQLFIDQWNTACGSFGRYNPETGYFELNGLTDITYEEAILILESYSPNIFYGITSRNNYVTYHDSSVRTLIPNTKRPSIMPANIMEEQGMFSGSANLEVVQLTRASIVDTRPTYLSGIFHQCPKIRRWLDVVVWGNSSSSINNNKTTWRFSPTSTKLGSNHPLEYFRFQAVNFNLDARYYPNISLETWRYLVDNRYSRTDANPITLTVHPNVYAKLTGDTSNAAAAELTEEELAQWQQLLEDAAEKQITFATT